MTSAPDCEGSFEQAEVLAFDESEAERNVSRSLDKPFTDGCVFVRLRTEDKGSFALRFGLLTTVLRHIHLRN